MDWLKRWFEHHDEDDDYLDEIYEPVEEKLDRLEALLDRVEKAEKASTSQYQLTKELEEAKQKITELETHSGLSAIATAEYLCVVCKRELVVVGEGNYIAAMCPDRIYGPKTYAQHTSIQFDGKRWYNAENSSFLDDLKRKYSTGIRNGVPTYSSTSFAFGTTPWHSKIKG